MGIVLPLENVVVIKAGKVNSAELVGILFIVIAEHSKPITISDIFKYIYL